MRTEVRKAMHEWLTSQLQKLVGVYDAESVAPAPAPVMKDGVIIYANQDAPRPKLPYMTMMVNAWRKIGHDQFIDPDTSGFRVRTGIRAFNVNLQAFGPTSFEIMEFVQNALEEERSLEPLRAAGVVVYEHTAVNDITAFLEDGPEERASMDLSCRTTIEWREEVGTIETIAGEATIGEKVIPFEGPPENMEE